MAATGEVPAPAESAHCESCGAGLEPGADACHFCGQVPTSMFRVARLGNLMVMHIQTGQYKEVDQLASEILKEIPEGALAWAARGLAIVHLGSGTGPPHVRVTDEDLREAVNCLEMATRLESKDENVAELRRRAAAAVAGNASCWLQRFIEMLRVRHPDEAWEAFCRLHAFYLTAEKLEPSVRAVVDQTLGTVDDAMEQVYGVVYNVDDYQRVRRPRSGKGRSLGDALKRILGW